MDKTAEIAVRWSEFESNHPGAEITDFCQYFLTKEREKQQAVSFFGSAVPPDAASLFTKLIGRISKLHSTYALVALKECGLKSFDEFLYLNAVKSLGKPKKTQVIYSNFNELSSGLLIITRLIESKLILEENDIEDKRSKKISLTKKGNEVIQDCYQKLGQINKIFFEEMKEGDLNLCTQLLVPVEARFSKKWMEDKAKQFDELMQENS